ncbi:hypothetical protein PoB_007538800 [Plakobranchus ocellatus]|uniref:Uncharacterized protein n=1 Tax=Plakobranchus ocellatus TaxID=259542 RepID=A0AAV4DWX2_9GAST|nr:hypothetical protein PoB_007538800 [Plakobranchus ocellatus]
MASKAKIGTVKSYCATFHLKVDHFHTTFKARARETKAAFGKTTVIGDWIGCGPASTGLGLTESQTCYTSQQPIALKPCPQALPSGSGQCPRQFNAMLVSIPGYCLGLAQD